MTIIGIARTHFKSRDDGRQIDGYTVYYTEPLTGEGDEGNRALHCFFPIESMLGDYYTYFNDKIEVSAVYNRYGKVVKFIKSE